MRGKQLLMSLTICAFWGLTACALVRVGVSIVQPPASLPPIEGKTPGLDGYIGGVKPGSYFHWTVMPWDGDDTRLLETRKEIDEAISRGEKRSSVLESYREFAQEKPLNAEAQFAWAYAAFCNHSKLEPGQDANSVLSGVREALEEPRVTNSYEYARMRWFFLQWSERFRISAQPILRNLATRLLEREPDDLDVKYTLAYELAQETKTNEQAFQYAQEYLAKFPERALSYFLMGRVYEARFGLTQIEKNALISQSYYQQAIDKATDSASIRSSAQWHIDDLKDRVKLFKKIGMLKSSEE